MILQLGSMAVLSSAGLTHVSPITWWIGWGLAGLAWPQLTHLCSTSLSNFSWLARAPGHVAPGHVAPGQGSKWASKSCRASWDPSLELAQYHVCNILLNKSKSQGPDSRDGEVDFAWSDLQGSKTQGGKIVKHLVQTIYHVEKLGSNPHPPNAKVLTFEQMSWKDSQLIESESPGKSLMSTGSLVTHLEMTLGHRTGNSEWFLFPLIKTEKRITFRMPNN